jgi:FkbM family methyltransferase
MHKGEDAEYYLKRGFRVVAVEADPELVEHCRNRFREHIASRRLEIVHGAIVDDEALETVTFYKNPKNSVWGTVVSSWADRNSRLGADSLEIMVPTVDLAELFSRHGCPYYLKIDIEGMDLVCLRRLLKTHVRPKYVSIESEKIDFTRLVEEFDTLCELGYRKFFIQQQVGISSAKVPSDSREGVYVDHGFVEGSSGPFGSDIGGDWLSRDEAIARYRKIFRDYRWFGDRWPFWHTPKGQRILDRLSGYAGRPLPGWYDTHAKM